MSVKKQILFVDDLTKRFQNFSAFYEDADNATVIWAQNPDEACRILFQFEFDEIWLDHDAGSGVVGDHHHYGKLMETNPKPYDITFFPVVCVIAAMKYKGKVWVHTGNNARWPEMVAFLRDHGVDADRPSQFTLDGIYGGREPGQGHGYM